jgi:AraC-like DNA-binding protein
MSSSAPDPVERDSRGILDPWLLRQRVRLTRYPPPRPLRGLVDRLWAVAWDLPPGVVHRQRVLTHPGANLSVGHGDGRAVGPAGRGTPVEARLNGVARGVTVRTLVGRGWAVAAMTRPGGLGAFISGSAADFTDRVVPLGQAIGCDEPALLRAMVAEPDEAARAGLLAGVLSRAVDPDKVRLARQVAGVARLAEADRSIRRLSQLCAAASVGQRTLQRLFLHYAGVSPTWVLRRYRLLEVAEAVRDGCPVSWSEVAADLGYADQAHLISDFKAATGQTPAAYAAGQRDLPGGPADAGLVGVGMQDEEQGPGPGRRVAQALGEPLQQAVAPAAGLGQVSGR